MKTFNIKTIAIIIFIIISGQGKTQVLAPTDTSERYVKQIRGVINNNKELVKFIEHSLRQRNLPKHLRNLALNESWLDRKQVSSAGAAGIWQFMPDHAKGYGLTEANRSDNYKSTKVAAISLANLYKKYNNWITVIAAYSCGEGGVSKAMKKAGSSDYTQFYKYLPSETIHHVEKYLNACYATGELNEVLNDYYASFPKSKAKKASKNIAKATQTTFEEDKPINSSMLGTQINVGYNLEVISSVLKVSEDEILAWNPKLIKNLDEKGESVFYLPKEMMGEFLGNKNKILQLSISK